MKKRLTCLLLLENFRQLFFYEFVGTIVQNTIHEQIDLGVYLHTKSLSFPSWVPKAHPLKKFNSVFKTIYTAQVVLKTKYKFSSAFSTMCHLIVMTGLLVVKTSLKNDRPSRKPKTIFPVQLTLYVNWLSRLVLKVKSLDKLITLVNVASTIT